MDLNDTKLQELDTIFQTLPSLPSSFKKPQCVSHKNEILVCGGYNNGNCYSYHTLKNQYKLICSYPETIQLVGHCVVKRISNNSDVTTLLSFGGQHKHVLVMKYKSVWDDTKKSKTEDIIQYNKWIFWTDNFHVYVEIGRNKDDYEGACAVIGGSNNHLLFIAYYPHNISVYDLNKYQFVKHHVLSSDNFLGYNCFVIKTKDKVSNKKKTELFLFCGKMGLSIEYDEQNNTFQFSKLPICTTMKKIINYIYVHVNDVILFFGGWEAEAASKSVHKYSIKDNVWMQFEYNLQLALYRCVGVLSADAAFVHIIGENLETKSEGIHLKTSVKEWMKEETEKERKWLIEEVEKMRIKNIKKDLKIMNGDIDLKELKTYKEISMVIEHWIRHALSVRIGWIDDFNKIISHFIMLKYFKSFQIAPQRFGSIDKIEFSPDCTKAVLILYDKPLRLWNIKLPEVKILECSDAFEFAQFSADGNMIMSCSRDGNIQFWDVESCKVIKKLRHPDNALGFRFSPDGKTLACYSYDKVFRIWNIESGQDIQTVSGVKRIEDICFSFDSQQIAMAQVGVIEMWNVKTGKQIRRFKAHTRHIKKLMFSLDGQLFVSQSLDGTIRIWDVESGNEVKTLKNPFNLVFFLDNKTILSCCYKSIQLWDVKSETKIQKLKGHQGDILAVQGSPDGNTLVSGCNKGISKLFYFSLLSNNYLSNGKYIQMILFPCV
ncbi:WD repeat-containing protein [Reticulomyxa filosa]|uniref:WD repeat-containing protein n=1 Tax=Reticulomyxa filosa TaxID=46433 RepID=X6MR20_RETFI|nr:WD repeat-containing protein [Reticulomyxa filosa]|eukprot:ETO16304.1 WD repeat-containing protein [Reticulomyxa filosa]